MREDGEGTRRSCMMIGWPHSSQNSTPSVDLYGGAGAGQGDGGDLRGDGASHGVDAFRDGRTLALRGDRFAAIAANADLRVDLDFVQKRHAEQLCHVLAFAVAEDVDAPVAMRAVEIAHVFDHAQDTDVALAAPCHGLA